MKAIEDGARITPVALAHGDGAEARLVERVIAVARTLLTTSALVVLRFDPPEPARYAALAGVVLLAYTAFALLLLLVLMRATSIPRLLPVAAQAADVVFAVVLTLLSAGPNGALATFLFYPLLAAAYRWGFAEVMATAVTVVVLMGIESSLVSTGVLGPALPRDMEVNRVLLRGIYIGAMGAAIGYFAESEKRRRLELRNLALTLIRAQLGSRFADSVNLVLASLQNIFGAKQVLLVVEEQPSGRVWLWSNTDSSSDEDERFPSVRREDYFFDAPGGAWHGAARLGRRGRFSVVAVDTLGKRLPSTVITLPRPFLTSHPCRRIIGVTLPLSDEWTGRVFVLNPSLGVHREQSARYALLLVTQAGPTLYSHYRVRHLRKRAEALERGRVARELHDGVTQSLIGLEMELVVLHRRAAERAPELAADLARVHNIVRTEITAVRELMEGIRAGDVDGGDLLPHLHEMIDRFSRYTGIAARFVSDGHPVELTPHVRRQTARIVHEALVNIRRHAGASRVVVRADANGRWWTLTIEDDGRGFPFSGRLSQEDLDRSRRGPRTISERLRLIGGMLAIESNPGVGSRLEVSVPCQSIS